MNVRNLQSFASKLQLITIVSTISIIATPSTALSKSLVLEPWEPYSLAVAPTDKKEIQKMINDAINQERENLHDRVQNEVDTNFKWTIALLTALITVIGFIPIAIGVFAWMLRRAVIEQITSEARAMLSGTKEEFKKALDKDMQAELGSQTNKFRDELEILKGIFSQEIERMKNENIEMHHLILEAQEEKSRLFQRLAEITPPSMRDVVTVEVQQEMQQLTEELKNLKAVHPQLLFTASEYVNQGDALFFEGKYSEAIKNYDEALKLQPDDYETLYKKGDVLYRQSQYEEAVSFYDRALIIKPSNNHIWRHWGNAIRRLGHQEEVIKRYVLEAEGNPDSYEKWYKLGNVQAGLNQLEKAVESYTIALSINPHNPLILHSRGNTLAILQNYSEAIKDYDEALKKDPNLTWALNSRGHALMAQRLYKEALEDYNKALKIDPEDGWILESKGEALCCLGRYDEALEFCNKAILHSHSFPGVWSTKAFLLGKLGFDKESSECYQKAIDRCESIIRYEPDAHDGWYEKSAIYLWQGDVDSAISSLQKAISLYPRCRAWAKYDRKFDNLRQDRRFQVLIAEKD